VLEQAKGGLPSVVELGLPVASLCHGSPMVDDKCNRPVSFGLELTNVHLIESGRCLPVDVGGRIAGHILSELGHLKPRPHPPGDMFAVADRCLVTPLADVEVAWCPGVDYNRRCWATGQRLGEQAARLLDSDLWLLHRVSACHRRLELKRGRCGGVARRQSTAAVRPGRPGCGDRWIGRGGHRERGRLLGCQLQCHQHGVLGQDTSGCDRLCNVQSGHILVECTDESVLIG